MKLGMFMQPVHDPKRNYTQVLDEDRETILLADELGELVRTHGLEGGDLRLLLVGAEVQILDAALRAQFCGGELLEVFFVSPTWNFTR